MPRVGSVLLAFIVLPSFAPIALADALPPGPCVAFSPYIDNLSPDQGRHPSAAVIDAALDVVVAKTDFRCIQVYGVLNGLDHTIVAAKARGLTVFQILWLDKDEGINQQSIARGIVLAKLYPETILRVSCGSEVRTRHGRTIAEQVVGDCVTRLRAAGVSQPLTSNETWWSWCNEASPCQVWPLASQLDWLGVNVFAWWENKFSGLFPCTPAASAVDFTIARVQTVRATYSSKEVILTEAGWPAGPDGYAETNRFTGQQCGVANEANQKLVVNGLIARLRELGWTGVIFSLLKEPWKATSEGVVGPHWGLFPATAPAPGSGDVDQDSLPDSFEVASGLNPAWGAGADGPAGDPDADGLTNLQELQQGRHPRGFFTRYFAEGATGSFFDLQFALANPDVAASSRVNLFFLLNSAATANLPVTVGPSSRATVNAETAVGALAAAEFSTVVESDIPIVADRTMKWDSTGYGAHAETSIAGPATRWFLAEGATPSGFDLFYLLQNPNAGTANVTVIYLRDSGGPLTQNVSLPGNSRQNIWVDTVQGLGAVNVSGVIDSSLPIIVERAMYLNLPGQPFGAGHESAGVTAAATSWFLAEGATGSFFDLFILIANPNAAAAVITANYLLENGTLLTKVHNVPGNSRYNIHVDTDLPQLADVAVSTTITSTQPVIVERAMWWPGPTAATWTEAHNSAGATTTGTRWALAEGEVATGTDTYVLVANTSVFAGSARVTLLYEGGAPDVLTIPLAANSRTNVEVRSRFPGSSGRRFGVLVESLGATPAQIVVERAMYMNAGGVIWAAGTNALATKLP